MHLPSKQTVFTATWRTPPWLPSGWGCRDRRLSRASESLCRQRESSRGRHRRPRLARLWTPERTHVPVPDGLPLLSSSSRRFHCGRGFSEIPLRPLCLARPLGTPRPAHTRDTNRKYCLRTVSTLVLWALRPQGDSGPQPRCFCPAPTALELWAAKGTAFAYPVENVFRGLAPMIRLVPHRPP